MTAITVCFNSARTIDRTIDSIAAQTCEGVEYIVVDGGSKDGTLDRLRARSDDIDLWISEPDQGISDAFNKAIALASGQYVALVNSDDWLEPGHFTTAVEALRASGADFVFGNLMFYPTSGEAPYVIVGETDYGRRILHTMPDLNHPSVVCTRKLYEQHGLYDTDLRIAMDYEWFLRGYKRGVRGVYVRGLTTHMSMEGVSHQAASRGLREVRDCSVRYGYPLLLAHLRHVIRVSRPPIRRMLKRLMPRSAYVWLRSRLNRNYRALGAGSH